MGYWDFARNQDHTYLGHHVYIEPLNLLRAVYVDYPDCAESLNQWVLHAYLHFIHMKFILACAYFQGILGLLFIVYHSIMEKSDRINTYQYKLRKSKVDEFKKL